MVTLLGKLDSPQHAAVLVKEIQSCNRSLFTRATQPSPNSVRPPSSSRWQYTRLRPLITTSPVLPNGHQATDQLLTSAVLASRPRSLAGQPLLQLNTWESSVRCH